MFAQFPSNPTNTGDFLETPYTFDTNKLKVIVESLLRLNISGMYDINNESKITEMR